MIEAYTELTNHVLSANFWLRLRNRQDGCFEPLATLAAGHPDVFAFGSGAQIARRCQVSQTSVVRFAHHLGFGGFLQMKQTFRLALKNRLKRAG